MRKLGIFAIFPPGAALSEEGLGRYLEILLREATATPGWQDEFEVVLNVPPWSKNWGRKVTKGTPILLHTLRIRTVGGAFLYFWGNKKSFFKFREKEIRTRRINVPAIAWTIHKWSAGIINVRRSNPLYGLLRGGCKFFARGVLYLVRRIRRREFVNIVSDVDLATAPLVRSESVELRKLFDSFFKKESTEAVDRESKKYDFIYLAHNRIPFRKASPPVAALIPDLIPLEHSELFENHSSRWKFLKKDIEETCKSSKIWITFSNETIAVAGRLKLLSGETQVIVIPHASQPPSHEWSDYLSQSDAGMGKPWTDYWWRMGLVKVSNPIFQNYAFNNRLLYCLYPTQYRPHKNVEQLIESWPKVLQSFPTVKLVLTADPVKNPFLVELVNALGLSLSVLFIQKMNGSELAAWTLRAQLVISASATEGAMPFMVSEALSAGVPFLISDTAVSREILSKEIQGISFLKQDDYASSIIKSLKFRSQILEKQEKWFSGYNRSWADVWSDWIDVARRELDE